MIIQKIKRLDDDPSEKRIRGGGATDERAIMAALARSSGKSYWQVKTRAKRPGKGGGTSRSPGVHSKDFKTVCEYLVEGKGTQENEQPYPDGEGRVEDAFSINLPTTIDLQQIDATGIREAEKWMGDTAALNTRIRATAVLHYVVGLPPEEKHKATPEFWRDVAPQILNTLDLSEHQALFVVHEDAGHPHMHVVINRVHPTTYKAKSPFQDMVALELLMRQLEKKYCLRRVKGRLINPLTEKKYTADEIRAGERPGKRKPRAAMAEVRRLAKESLKEDKPFTHSSSWTDLEQRLSKHGYNLRAEGAGLLLRDAKGQTVKVSDVAGKGLGRRKLEERFGSWTDFQNDKTRAASEGISLEEAAVRRLAESQRQLETTKATNEKRKADARTHLLPMLDIGARILVTSEDPKEPVPDYLGVAMNADDLKLGLDALSSAEIVRLHHATDSLIKRVTNDQLLMRKAEGGCTTPAYYGAENARINLDAALRAIQTQARASGIDLKALQKPPKSRTMVDGGIGMPKREFRPLEAKNADASPREIAANLSSYDDTALLGHFDATRKAARDLQALKRHDNTPQHAIKSLRMAAAMRGMQFALKERGVKVPQKPRMKVKTKSRGMEM